MSSSPTQEAATPQSPPTANADEATSKAQQADDGESDSDSSDSWRLRDKLAARKDKASKPQWVDPDLEDFALMLIGDFPSEEQIRAETAMTMKLLAEAEAQAQIPPPEDNPSDAEQLSAREASYILAVFDELYTRGNLLLPPIEDREGWSLLLHPLLRVARPISGSFNIGPKATRALLQREVWQSLNVKTPNLPAKLPWPVNGVTQPWSWEHALTGVRLPSPFAKRTPIHLLDDVIEAVKDAVSAVLPTKDDSPARASEVEAELCAHSSVGEAVVVAEGPQVVYAFITPAADTTVANATPVAEVQKALSRYTSATEQKVVVLDTFPELLVELSPRRALRRALAKRAGKEDIQNMATKGHFSKSIKEGHDAAVEALAEKLAAALD